MKIASLLIASALLTGSIAPIATAQALSNQQLQANLQTALCLDDWDAALSAVRLLTGSPQTTPSYRQQLATFRYQLEEYRATNARFDHSGQPECVGAIAAASQASQVSTPVATPVSPLNWERARQAVANGAGRSGSAVNPGTSGLPQAEGVWSTGGGSFGGSSGSSSSSGLSFDNLPAFGDGFGRSGAGNGSSGSCNSPSDIASDGSRCGGRAASSRPGGR